MAFNELLTNTIGGRTIHSVTPSTGLLQITFTDGSVIKIKTGGPPPAADALIGHTVKQVHQADTQMDISFTDHTSGRIRLAAATSSVILRDRDGNFEYAD
jgi:hypothetical protein